MKTIFALLLFTATLTAQVKITGPTLIQGAGNSTFPGCSTSGSNGINCTGNSTISGLVNNKINVLLAPGADFPAQVAYAQANLCVSGQACSLWTPPNAAVTWSSGPVILSHQGTTLECAQSGVNGYYEQLNYTGTGTAIIQSGVSTRITGCGLLLGSSAAVGISQTGQYPYADHINISGGGTGTIMFQAVGAAGFHLSNFRFDQYTGTAFYCENINDGWITDGASYGVLQNTTSIGANIDSACNGLYVSNWVNGAAGLHGWYVHNTANPGLGVPTWAKLVHPESDCAAGGDGMLFDASLGTGYLGWTIENVWTGGAGQTCQGSSGSISAPNSAGIHISGGTGITIHNGNIRANVGAGVLIDNAQVSSVTISDVLFSSNNWTPHYGVPPGTTHSQIEITAAAQSIAIHDNHFDNNETGYGYPAYGINVSSVAAGGYIGPESCSGQITGCIHNLSTGTMAYYPLTSPVLYANGRDAQMYETFQAGLTTNQNEGLAFQDYTGVEKWRIYSDQNSNLQVWDSAQPLSRLQLVPGTSGGNTQIESVSTGAVQVNQATGAGTGGFQVYSGGATPAQIWSASTSGANSVEKTASSGDAQSLLQTTGTGANTVGWGVSASDGHTYFSDSGGSTYPITVGKGAPTGSLSITSAGAVGISSVTISGESGAATYLACYTTGGRLGHCATAPSGTPPTCGCTAP
jgi:hypothetical protein